MTHETVQDFPAGIPIKSAEITALNVTGTRIGAASLRQEVQVFSGQMQKMKIEFLPMDPETGGILEAFLLSLRGAAGTFRFGDPWHSTPAGFGRGDAELSSPGAGGDQVIQTDGWLPNVEDQLKLGDYLQLGDSLHRVIANNVHSNASGEADITIWPNLRGGHAANEKVVIVNPRGLWRLANTELIYSRQAVGEKHTTELECIEAL